MNKIKNKWCQTLLIVTIAIFPSWLLADTSDAPAAVTTACRADALEDPTKFVEDVANDVLAKIDADPSIQKSQQASQDLVLDILRSDVDIKFMSEYIAGQYYTSANAADQSAFEAALRVLVSRLYAKAVMQYHHDNIKFYPVRGGYQNKPTVMVNSLIIQSDTSKIPVSFRLKKECNTWQFYDLGVDGIWALSSFRAQIRQIIQDLGPTAKLSDVTKALTTHNDKS